ncbi:tRNA lysidine(34) synthetase TilS [Bremerella sp. JC817]|uniref:tRNA lysidine(34) synthetase TilS n=1 Tax=Bremerella sp. JC817 TaxID=3231756 RepID=UPI003457BECB
MSDLPLRFLENWPLAAWAGRVILIGVSGGADSVALLRLMAEAVDDNARSRMWAIHVNHRLRGDASDGDLAFVRELSGKLGVNFRSFSLSPALLEQQSAGLGIEAAARQARYAAFKEAACEVEARYLVTAHHQDDQIETVLHRILRGTGVAGLRGIASARQWLPGVGLVRPMLPFTRAEIVDYLQRCDQDWREDASNQTLEFTRNKIRQQTLPSLREDFGSQVDTSLVRLAEQARQCQEVIDDLVSDLYDTAVWQEGDGSVRVDLRKIRQQRPYLVQELMVRIWTERNWSRQDMSQVAWQKLAELAMSSQQVTTDMLPGAIRALRDGDFLILQR